MKRRAVQFLWYFTNTLLALSFLFLLCTIAWEYSTRRYLKGFSDAIIPLSASPEEKIEAILAWMDHGPSRKNFEPSGLAALRDPQQTLNYQALLRVYVFYINVLVNLANGGLPSRRLLLLNNKRQTDHVVAEVLVRHRWVVVDPAFRTILRSPEGQLLTREELRDPAVLFAATRNLRGYSLTYDYDITAHVRISRVPVVGRMLRPFLDRTVPGWEDSVYWTLVLERGSFGALLFATFLTLFLFVVRLWLRWYGEARLGLRRLRFRDQVLRAAQVLMGEAA